MKNITTANQELRTKHQERFFQNNETNSRIDFSADSRGGGLSRLWHLDFADWRQPHSGLQASNRQRFLVARWHWLHPLLRDAFDLYRTCSASRFWLWPA